MTEVNGDPEKQVAWVMSRLDPLGEPHKIGRLNDAIFGISHLRERAERAESVAASCVEERDRLRAALVEVSSAAVRGAMYAASGRLKSNRKVTDEEHASTRDLVERNFAESMPESWSVVVEARKRRPPQGSADADSLDALLNGAARHVHEVAKALPITAEGEAFIDSIEHSGKNPRRLGKLTRTRGEPLNPTNPDRVDGGKR